MIFNIDVEDICQVVIGAILISTPIALTAEFLEMALNIGVYRLVGLVLMSLVLISTYVYYSIFQSLVQNRFFIFIFRIFVIYILTFLTVLLVLFVFNAIDFNESVEAVLRKVIALSFPSSLGAVVVDGFDKE